MKRIFLGILLVVMLGYIIYAFFHYDQDNKLKICQDVNVSILNVEGKQFIDPSMVKKEILESKVNPVGNKIDDTNTWDVEQLILKNEHVKNVEVYWTNNNNLEIRIKEKKPILRVIPNNGVGFYLDEDGGKMKLSDNYSAYVPVATGNISDSIILKELCTFAIFLGENKFWNAQVDQILVDNDRDIHFITRVGAHIVNIGDMKSLEKKLNRLMIFYKDGLNKIGWNKYSKINLKFDNQVVCSE